MVIGGDDVTTWRCKEVCLSVVENFVDNLVFLGLFLLNFLGL